MLPQLLFAGPETSQSEQNPSVSLSVEALRTWEVTVSVVEPCTGVQWNGADQDRHVDAHGEYGKGATSFCAVNEITWLRTVRDSSSLPSSAAH